MSQPYFYSIDLYVRVFARGRNSMSKNPWTDIEEAFEPMYDEVVVVNTKNGSRQSLNVIVSSDSTGDALADDMIGSDRMDITIIVKKNEWGYLDKITEGDIVVRYLNGKEMKYRVSEIVDDFVFGRIINARQV